MMRAPAMTRARRGSLAVTFSFSGLSQGQIADAAPGTPAAATA